MNAFGKILIFISVVALLIWAKTGLYDNYFAQRDKNAQTRATEEVFYSEPANKTNIKETASTAKQYVTVYFLYIKNDGNNVFTKIKRELPQGENKLSFAIKELLKGPDYSESAKKYYTEIPSSTKALSIIENDKKVIVDLSSDFQFGGGSDSLYNRVQQILKTVIANCGNKEVYLYLDGRQADVIGGEGLMIKQPLKEDSLYNE